MISDDCNPFKDGTWSVHPGSGLGGNSKCAVHNGSSIVTRRSCLLYIDNHGSARVANIEGLHDVGCRNHYLDGACFVPTPFLISPALDDGMALINIVFLILRNTLAFLLTTGGMNTLTLREKSHDVESNSVGHKAECLIDGGRLRSWTH